MTKYILVILGVTAIVALGMMIDAQSSTPTTRSAESLEPTAIFALGRIEGRTPEVELRPRLAGRVVEVLVEEGQFVEQGQVILRLDDEQYQHEASLATAQFNLARAQLGRLVNGAHLQERAEAKAMYDAKQAELERAQLTWDRTYELRKDGVISQQDADNQRTLVTGLTAEVAAVKARFELITAEARADDIEIENARIEAAKASLDLANVNVQRTTLKAPRRGQILKLDVEVGELIGPQSLLPAVILTDTSRFHARAFVEEMDAPQVKVGMSARITADGLLDKKFTGRVIRLSPRMGRKELWSNHPTERYDTKTREVWIELEETAELIVGLRVDVEIDLEDGGEVPSTASVPDRHSLDTEGPRL
ncbi:MAG: HlyD family efflux transporter periplasmic adaptor subunit [Thermoguttaceae bacterium]